MGLKDSIDFIHIHVDFTFQLIPIFFMMRPNRTRLNTMGSRCLYGTWRVLLSSIESLTLTLLQAVWVYHAQSNNIQQLEKYGYCSIQQCATTFIIMNAAGYNKIQHSKKFEYCWLQQDPTRKSGWMLLAPTRSNMYECTDTARYNKIQHLKLDGSYLDH